MVCSDTSNVTTPLLPTQPFSGCNHKNSTYKEVNSTLTEVNSTYKEVNYT